MVTAIAHARSWFVIRLQSRLNSDISCKRKVLLLLVSMLTQMSFIFRQECIKEKKTLRWSKKTEKFKSPTHFLYKEAQQPRYMLIKCIIYWYEEWAPIVKTEIEVLLARWSIKYDSQVYYKKIRRQKIMKTRLPDPFQFIMEPLHSTVPLPTKVKVSH